MTKTLLFISIFSFSCLAGFAQTKKIAHRSHSGAGSSFINKEDDNFGLPPDYSKKRDSLMKKLEEQRREDSLARSKAEQDSIKAMQKPKSKPKQKPKSNGKKD